MAGLTPAAVICEIMNEDGTMARLPELIEFARIHSLQVLSVADIIAWRLQRERIVRRRHTGAIRPGFLGPGEPFTAHVYDTEVEDTEYLALVRGDVAAATAAGAEVLVRVQSLDPVGDPFALRADVDAALRSIDHAGLGVYLYVYNHARTSLVRAFERVAGQRAPTPAKTADSSDALRDFGLGAQVLADLGLHKIRLMSHLDRRIPGIEGFGIEVVERVSIPPGSAARRVPVAEKKS
jgi:3,4-dihydroxy 2-butanone 4-phosphate synthase/GTP cyclohydrolase II